MTLNMDQNKITGKIFSFLEKIRQPEDKIKKVKSYSATWDRSKFLSILVEHPIQQLWKESTRGKWNHKGYKIISQSKMIRVALAY